MLGYVQFGHIPDDVQIGHRGRKQELVGLTKSACSRKYDKDPIAGPHHEKATVTLTTLTVDLAGNQVLEGNLGT